MRATALFSLGRPPLLIREGAHPGNEGMANDAQKALDEISQLSTVGDIKSRAKAWGVDMEELKRVMRTAEGNPRTAAVKFIVNAIASGAAARRQVDK